MRGFVIAGTHSGVGKTTITVGLIAALRRRGLRVQPFKAGPDYIDPTYHSAAAGLPSRNLDTWLVPRPYVVELFGRAMSGKDVAVVEGVMGLFDGRSAGSDEGSSADLAKLLGLPVVLVVDASAAARSIAATVLGFKAFDPQLRVAGVIVNRVGSVGHAEMCREAIEGSTGLPVLGALLRDESIALPERHLGLVPTVEGATAATVFDRIAHTVASQIDIPALLALADIHSIRPEPSEASPERSEGPFPVEGSSGMVAQPLFPVNSLASVARIAIAMDKAFSFYYQDSLDLLQAWGAELVPFSPLAGAALPQGVSGVYIGGGFPELYARDLSENGGMMASLRHAAARGVPVYGECGGLMYLGERIVDFEGVAHRMAALVPASSRLDKSRLTLGYRNIRALSEGPVLATGQEARGHEFHWSRLETEASPVLAAYDVLDQPGRREGFRQGSVLASYVHLHFASDTRLAPRFVQSCRQAREAIR